MFNNKDGLVDSLLRADTTGLFDKAFAEYLADCLINDGAIFPPCKVGDTFYGVNETSYDAYCTRGFKWGKRKGYNENVLIVLTTYDMEFVWGEEAFMTSEEAKKSLERSDNNK